MGCFELFLGIPASVCISYVVVVDETNRGVDATHHRVRATQNRRTFLLKIPKKGNFPGKLSCKERTCRCSVPDRLLCSEAIIISMMPVFAMLGATNRISLRASGSLVQFQ